MLMGVTFLGGRFPSRKSRLDIFQSKPIAFIAGLRPGYETEISYWWRGLRFTGLIGKTYLKSLMAEQNHYPNAVRILETEIKLADKSYELLRETCLLDKEIAAQAQEKYDLACELRHARNILLNSKPSGIL